MTESTTTTTAKVPRKLVENWHTGEACLWIANDEPLYRAALRCRKFSNPYARFIEIQGADYVGTNGFRWTDKRIQRRLVNAFIRSLE